jgi:peptidoglycan/xylan/chitin deacetylase (PgdA/CDA1 family)
VKKILFNVIYNGILSKNIVLRFSKNKRFIFLFHDVSPSNSIHNHPVYSTDIKVFQRNIEWIQKNFKIVDLDTLTDENNLTNYPQNLASIVFDDGFSSLFDVVFPYFTQKEIPFTIFANQTAIQENWLWCSNLMMALNQKDFSYLRKIYEHFASKSELSFEAFIADPVTCLSDNQLLNDDYAIFEDSKFTSQKVYLDEKDVKFLHSKGVIIGNHTKTHKHLSSCSKETIDKEILGNKLYLQELLGVEIKHFAIPFGFHTTYNEYAIRIAREAHSFVYDTEKNRVKTPLQTLIPRVGMQNEDISKIISYVNYPILKNV